MQLQANGILRLGLSLRTEIMAQSFTIHRFVLAWNLEHRFFGLDFLNKHFQKLLKEDINYEIE